MVIKLAGQEYNVGFEVTQGARGLRLQLMSDQGDPFGTLSVDLDEAPARGCVWLKHWSENEEIVNQLMEQQALVFTGRVAYTPRASAPEVQAIDPALLP